MEFNIFATAQAVILDPSIIWDSVIIGGGPAGYNAALYMKRKGFRPLLLSGNRGGQLANTQEIENYLGFNEISGPDMIETFHKQIADLDVDILEATFVEKLEKKDDLFQLDLSNKETLTAKTVIIATGGEHRTLGVEGEETFSSKGVSYCAICDAPFFKNKDVVVVGGGDSAVEAAIDLSKWAKTVHVVHRSKWRAEKILLDQMMATENVTYELGSTIQKIHGDNTVTSVEILHDGQVTQKEVQGIFVEIGQDPRIDLVKEFVSLNENNEIIVDKFKQTSAEGIYAAGDVTDAPFKQIITAAADGAIAALSASNYIIKKEGEL